MQVDWTPRNSFYFFNQFLQFLTFLEESISLLEKVWELEEVTGGPWSYLVEHQPPQITTPHSRGSRRLQHSKLFSFLGVFCTSLPNQIQHTWVKFQLQICKYHWARIIFVDKGLDSKLQRYGPCKKSSKKPKTSHSNRSGHIKGDVMQNHEQKKKSK